MRDLKWEDWQAGCDLTLGTGIIWGLFTHMSCTDVEGLEDWDGPWVHLRVACLCGLVSSHSGGLWVVRLSLWWLRTPGSSLLRTRRRLHCLFWPCLRSHAGPLLQHSFDCKKVKSPPRFKGSVHRPHLSIRGESHLYCRKAGGMGIIVAAILGKYSLSHQVFFISRNHSSAFDPLPFSSFPTISPLILQKESRKAVL